MTRSLFACKQRAAPQNTALREELRLEREAKRAAESTASSAARRAAEAEREAAQQRAAFDKVRSCLALGCVVLCCAMPLESGALYMSAWLGCLRIAGTPACLLCLLRFGPRPAAAARTGSLRARFS